MSTIKKVTLAGAGQGIGATVLAKLVDAGFEVTVLTRKGSAHDFPSGAKVVDVDYDDLDSLKAALKSQDALVSTLGYAAMLKQDKLIDAAIANGVQRVLPSEYGTDPDCAAVRKLPVFGYKVQIEKYVKQAVQGTSTTYTLVANNEFFDWDMDFRMAVDIKGKKMEIFDGGDVPFSAATLDFVARGIVAVLQHPAETANRVVRLHGMSMTQNRQLEMIQRYTGKEGWTMLHTNTFELEKQGYELLQKDPQDMWTWAMPFIKCSVWGQRFGVDFSKNNDNALLGLKEMSEQEIEEVIRSRA